MKPGQYILASLIVSLLQVSQEMHCCHLLQVLDLWQYQVLRNWGFSGSTFVLDFADTSYPIKTNQGRWIADLISFHIEAIARDEGNPPPPPHEVFHPTSSSPPPLPRGSSQQGIVEQHYEMNTADTMERSKISLDGSCSLFSLISMFCCWLVGQSVVPHSFVVNIPIDHSKLKKMKS